MSTLNLVSAATIECTLISPNLSSLETFSQELTKAQSISSVDRLDSYPDSDTINRMLRLSSIDLLVIDCSEFARALEIISVVRINSPESEIVALCEEDVQILGPLMRCGVRHYVSAKAPINEVRDVFVGAIDRLQAKPRQPRFGGDIITFLPSKPGSGSSTIAVNTAYQASKVPGKRVLLADFDQDAPVQAFLNKLHPSHFLQEAMAKVNELDTDMWSRIVSTRERLEILPSDPSDPTSAEKPRISQLLKFFRKTYDLTFIDLAGPLDTISVEALSDSKRIYLICTQELASVHLAMTKAERLRALGLSKSLRVILNRCDAHHVMNEEHVAELLGLPIELTVPNGYTLAKAAAEQGSYIAAGTPLGHSYVKLAQSLMKEPIKGAKEKKSLFGIFTQTFAKKQPASA